MNLACADQIAKAVLYEGYMLYPYRPSSVKNRQRWNFGIVYPQAYSDAQDGEEPCCMRTECLVRGSNATMLEGKVQFLRLQTRSTTISPLAREESLPNGWQEAVEQDIGVPACSVERLCRVPLNRPFSLQARTQVDPEHNIDGEIVGSVARQKGAIDGTVEAAAVQVGTDLFRVGIHVRNTTPVASAIRNRDEVLLHSMISTHVILGVEKGEFVSLLEPPEELQQLAAQCKNVGAWPVLVGNPGQRDILLASPIILYDYPQIAPESAGDLFDGTEIDEILSLRIMTLTDEEKREIRHSDERARLILERTENMPPEQFMKLHGAVRGLRRLKEDVP